MCKRMVHDLENPGKVKIIEVPEHRYAWSGTIPCTGVYRCVYCGKPVSKDSTENQKGN